MDKKRVHKHFRSVRDVLNPGGSLSSEISMLLSLAEQGYIDCELVSDDGEVRRVTNIFVTNKGHDFLTYAKELEDKGVNISNMSYEDIEHYGRVSLLKSLGLM